MTENLMKIIQVSEELLKVKKPQLPEAWDYNESVRAGRQLFTRWKDITIEMATHFWIAREMLSKEGNPHRELTGRNRPLKTWTDYCQEVSGNG